MESQSEGRGFRRILIPIGPQVPGEQVLDRAAFLIRRPGVIVRLLTVIEKWGRQRDNPGYPADPRHEEVMERVEVLRNSLSDRGIAAQSTIRFGPTAQTIVDESVAAGSDLIIMGTRGRTEIQRLFLGSAGQGVLRLSRIPVLLLRSPEKSTKTTRKGPEVSWKRVFIPLDGTSLSEQILPAAVTLARDIDLEVCISRVVPEPPTKRAWRMATEYLDELAHRLRPQVRKVTSEILTGDPGVQAITAGRRGYDLIAMASHGRGPFGAFFWGSETAHVLSETVVPVLAFRGQRRRQPAARQTTAVTI